MTYDTVLDYHPAGTPADAGYAGQAIAWDAVRNDVKSERFETVRYKFYL